MNVRRNQRGYTTQLHNVFETGTSLEGKERWDRCTDRWEQEIETWVSALAHYDNNEFDESLKEFDGISDTSKILFNCGVIHATLGEHEKAVRILGQTINTRVLIVHRSNVIREQYDSINTSPSHIFNKVFRIFWLVISRRHWRTSTTPYYI